MSYENPGNQWCQSSAIETTDPEFLEDLAQWCERLEPGEQRKGFDRILVELIGCGTTPGDGNFGRKVELLVEAAAFESAAVAMIPHNAIYSGGRMKDGSFVAQVIPDASAGAHSRHARSLAMAWLAALLRAMARQAAEARTA